MNQDYAQGDSDVPRLVLTDQDRAAITRRASSGIVRTLAAQAAMLGMAVLVSWLVAGGAAAVSAFIGAAAYFVPNALFALRLLVGLFGPLKSSPFTFFVGEAFKLGSAVVVLGLAAWLGRGWLVWPAMLFGLLCVLKGYVLLLLFRRLP
ncbi:ATP synthase subunit I [Pusillimonas sp. SM2304]|uniref:ATP synthase subunit I n=1 Tax=Pusillimonas sp. SM2304 TaxID=3073241 RepID=UPI0028756660|nr:ATP synthase subunit I [Pusillimonas sp. SM2304]MDS1140277.1 ATP synthase subunit I [Pusillimonas sp. SM2304]